TPVRTTDRRVRRKATSGGNDASDARTGRIMSYFGWLGTDMGTVGPSLYHHFIKQAATAPAPLMWWALTRSLPKLKVSDKGPRPRQGSFIAASGCRRPRPPWAAAPGCRRAS